MRILSQREYFAFRFGMSDEEYQQHTAHVDRLLTELGHGNHDTRAEHGKVAANGKTHWTPERRRQHQEIIRHFYDQMQASGVPQEGKGLILGGLGGSGKGHAQQQPNIPLESQNYYTIDPDEIKKEMHERGMIPKVDHLSPMETSGIAHEEASDLAKRVAMLGYRQKRNLLWDITMSSDNSVGSRINSMRKMGYGQVDGAFVDADPMTARERVKNRHRQDEEPFRDAGEGMGGRWVPEELTRGSLPTPGSGKLSKNAEVFDRLRPQFDNTMDIDGTTGTPSVRNQSGFRWSTGSIPTWQPSGGGNLMARRLMAWFATADENGGVDDLIDQYAEGGMTFIELVDVLASYDYSDPSIDADADEDNWAQIYDRSETDPDPDSFFWVEAAADDGRLVPRQVDLIVEAIDRYHAGQGDPDYVEGDGEDDGDDEDDVDQFVPDDNEM